MLSRIAARPSKVVLPDQKMDRVAAFADWVLALEKEILVLGGRPLVTAKEFLSEMPRS